MGRDESGIANKKKTEGPLRSDQLSDEDRKWLALHISRAVQKAFPASERIGKSRQQDFYFRELLEVLVENIARHGEPITGGDYAEIWQFTRQKVKKWRSDPNSRRGRAGYRRESIKTLVHEWKAAFSRHSRSVSSNGTIQFSLDAPDPASDDLVLRASVANLKLVSGAVFNLEGTELSLLTRLPREGVPESEDDQQEKEQLLREARKLVRRVEGEYLAKLSAAPLEFIKEEVGQLQRARRDYRRLAAAVLIVVGTAMAAYKILWIPHVRPVFDISPNARGGATNVVVDRQGRIALADSGKRISDWVNTIVDPKGGSMHVLRQVPGGAELGVATNEVAFDFSIPEKWHHHPEDVLEREGSCTHLLNPDRGVLCVMLMDIRSEDPAATTQTIKFGANWGDDHKVFSIKEERINAIPSRVLLTGVHGYLKDGVYDATLFTLADAKLRGKPSYRMTTIGRFIFEKGKVELKASEGHLPTWSPFVK